MSRRHDMRGAGGGGGKGGGEAPRVPVESADSLRSKSYAQVLDLLCEGEIDGLVNGLRSVYLDGVPIENEDGQANFSGVTVQTRTGTQGQSRLSGFSETASEQSVNVEVTAATPVVRSISSADVDAVRVRIAVPGLSVQNPSTGDITGTSVTIAIDVQANGGGYVAQPIGRVWSSSPNPAVTAADGIQITVEWQFSGLLSVRTSKFEVQYRQVGAGSWTTYRSDSFASSDIYSGLFASITVRGGVRYPRRVYTITGLPNLIYEARVVKTSGDGTLSVIMFRIATPILTDTITGKTTSAYQRSYRIPLTGSPPWDIRVRRITADSASAILRNKTYWDAYAELIEDRVRYPNSAVVGLSVDAAQFSAIPVRGYDVKLLRVKIPSNYDPVTRVYTGVWDGTFTVAWTDNPAWCFYDLLTNTRYGLGTFLVAAQVDKWALYAIGKYCDEFVPTGYGHVEPRFTCNLYLQTQAEAFQVLTSMASIFRGMVYWGGGAVTAVQDAPGDPVFLFTEANVEDGTFTYSGSSHLARHTTALVTWNDPDDGYKQAVEYVEDVAGIARYGVRSTQLAAVGCISRGQARRVGEWLLYSEQYETETVMLRCGHDGTYVRPGSLFAVQDAHRAGARFGGRIVAAASGSVTIDQAVTIVSGQTYTLKVVSPDGTLATKTVTNAPGSATVLTISGTFTSVPIVGAVWVLTSTALAPRLYRAISVAEIDRHRYEIMGLAHHPGKFASIDRDQPLEMPTYSTLTAVPAMPGNVAISESMVIRGGVVLVVVTVTWDPVVGATRYRVAYRRDSGNYVTLPETAEHQVDLVDVLPGFYEVRVTALTLLQIESAAGTASAQVFGKTARPADVTGFVVARTEGTLAFAWVGVPDLDLDYYELRFGTTWAAGVPLGRTSDTRITVPTAVGGTYLIKAVDTSGNESLNVSAIVVASHTDINVVVTQNDAPSWAGTHNQTAADSSGLTLAGQATWSSLTNTWSTYAGSWLQTGNPYASGTYVTVPIDLGQVMVSRVEIIPTVLQSAIGQEWTDWTQPWTTYTDPWSGTPGMIAVTYEMALSQDAVAWGAWQTYQAGHYSARAYKFRLTLTAVDPLAYLPRVTSFVMVVDVPDRVLHFEDQATSAGGTTLTFAPAFVNVQTVTGTIQAGAIGDTFRVTSKTNASAVVTVYDSAGSPKAGVVDVDVFGYGSI